MDRLSTAPYRIEFDEDDVRALRDALVRALDLEAYFHEEEQIYALRDLASALGVPPSELR